jgi:vitamin B12 transporter
MNRINSVCGPSGTSLPRLVVAAVVALMLTSPGLAQEDDDDAESLEELIVTTSRIPTPAREIGTAVSLVTAEDIELQGYASMADVLRTQPGIGVSNSGGPGKVTAVRIRGEESYRTLVMIDGVEVSDPTGTQVGPNFATLLTTSDIERVEILRGPQGFMYGADAGGVVNIMTRTGTGDAGGQIGIEAGDLGSRQIDANVYGGGDDGDFYVSIADAEADGFNARASDIVLADDDGYENTTVHTKLGWNVTDDFRLQLVARDIDASANFDQCSFPARYDCVADNEQTTIRLSADWATGDLTHLFAYGNTDIMRKNFAGDVQSFATNGDLTRIEYIGSFRPGESTTFVYGVDLREEDIVTSSNEALKRDQNAFYAEYQGRFNDAIFVTFGARRDDNDDFGTHTSLRATLAYLSDLDNGTLKYRLGFGTGFRAPSLSEIAYNNGPFSFPPASSTLLSEEQSSGYDFGVEYATDNGLYLEATYFDQEIEDEIYFDLAGFSGYLQSPGVTESTGVELVAEIPMGEDWTFIGNVTFNDTETAAGEQRIRRPERLANLGVRFLSADERLRFLANYRISADSVDEIFGVGRVALPDYEVLDLSIAYSLNATVEIFGRVENATDEDYLEVTGFLTGGSMAAIGVRLSF